MTKKLLIFILTYNAERTIGQVLERIPASVLENDQYTAEILVLDDASRDRTCEVVKAYIAKHPLPLTLLSNPVNQGYGGNQKVGYTYASTYGFDAVVMLHGDGQYPPEMIETLASPILHNHADAVFGSRMLKKKEALKGGMPLYKFIGNRVLTIFQNLVTGETLSEFHTGYRAYKVASLQSIPLSYNSDDFDFDTDIILQLFGKGMKIIEIAIPTHYGEEVCHVNGVKYAWQVVKATLLSRIQKYGIYYNPKFDLEKEEEVYKSKVNFDSSHSYAIDQIKPGSVVLDFGCGSGHVARALKEKNCRVYGIDQYVMENAQQYFTQYYTYDINDPAFLPPLPPETVDYIVLLDVVEHLSNPEIFLKKLRETYSAQEPIIIVTTGNVAFALVRLSLLIGSFNYGKRGILDLTHKRLFTFASLRRLLEQQGYAVRTLTGIPAPIPFIIGNNKLSKMLLAFNLFCIRISKGFFSYQMGSVAKMRPTLDVLLQNAEQHSPLFRDSE